MQTKCCITFILNADFYPQHIPTHKMILAFFLQQNYTYNLSTAIINNLCKFKAILLLRHCRVSNSVTAMFVNSEMFYRKLVLVENKNDTTVMIVYNILKI